MAGILIQKAGRLGKNASVKSFDNGGASLNFSMAVDDDEVVKVGDKFEHRQGVCWLNIQVSGYHSAEAALRVSRYLGKGAVVEVTGRLDHTPEGYPRQYKRTDGSIGTSFDVKVVAGNLQLLKGVDTQAAAGSTETKKEGESVPPTSEDF